MVAAAAAKLLQSYPTLCDPINSSPPGSPVLGILQARTLEWVAISFSNAWKWEVKVKSLSRVRPLVTQWTAAYQAPPSMGFSRQQYWSGVPLPSPTNGYKTANQNHKEIHFTSIKVTSFTLFLWGLRHGRLPQNEAQHLFPNHWLPEAHWSGQWMKNFVFSRTSIQPQRLLLTLWVKKGRLLGPNRGWEWQTGSPHGADFPHEEDDPWLSLPAAGQGPSCYTPRGTGERKRTFVQGCIVDANLSVLNPVIVKKGGEKDIPGHSDTLCLVTWDPKELAAAAAAA